MPLPRFILRGEYSINAKLLYALLLGRTQLSQKSGWVSEDGNVYVIYTIRQMANDLNRSERTVKAALAELEKRASSPASGRAGTGQTVFSSGCPMRCSVLPVQRASSAQWMGWNLPLVWGKICP